MQAIALTIQTGCQVLPPRCRTWRHGETTVPVRVQIAEATAGEAPILAVVETFYKDGSGRERITYRYWQGGVYIPADLRDHHHTDRPAVTFVQYLHTRIKDALAIGKSHSLREEEARSLVAQHAALVGQQLLVVDGIPQVLTKEPAIYCDRYREWTVGTCYEPTSEDVYRLDEEADLRTRLAQGRFTAGVQIGATIDLRRPDLLRNESRHARNVRRSLEHAVEHATDSDVRSLIDALGDLITNHDPAVLPAEVTLERLRFLQGELRWFGAVTMTPAVRTPAVA